MGGRIQNLGRPTPGDENTVTLSTGVRFAKIISRKFICPACMTFCGELIPIIDGKTRQWMRANKKTLVAPELQVKIFCYSGCHDNMHWGWKSFDWNSKQSIDSIRAWPEQWKTDKGAIDIERVVREEQGKK